MLFLNLRTPVQQHRCLFTLNLCWSSTVETLVFGHCQLCTSKQNLFMVCHSNSKCFVHWKHVMHPTTPTELIGINQATFTTFSSSESGYSAGAEILKRGTP